MNKIKAYEALRTATDKKTISEKEKAVVKILKQDVAPELNKFDIYETNGRWFRVSIAKNGKVNFTEEALV